jgi:hypothetical protein
MNIVVARFALVCVSLIIAHLMFMSISDAKIDPENTIGIWLFDEGKGNVAKDTSGNGNDGELMNGPKWTDGKFGKALEFDGKDDYVNAGEAEILKPTADVTFVAWVYWDGGNYVLATGGQTSSTGYAITYDPNTSQIWFGVSTGKKSATTGYIQAPSRKVWHHLAGAYDDSDGELIAYVDGKEYATAKANGNVLENKWPALHIGKPNNVDAYYIQGIIDEVAVFNVALTEDDINTIMTRGLEKAFAVSAVGKLATAWGTIKSQ